MRTITHFLKWSLGLAEAETATTREERECLARHAAGKKVLVELGVWHGVTTSLLRRVMDPEGLLFAVDPYFPGRLGFSMPQVIAKREVGRSRGGAVEWICKTSVDASVDFRAKFGPIVEFLFIDAGHEFEHLMSDWESWSGLISSGGVVGLHDSRSSPKRNLDGIGSVVYTAEAIRRDPRFEFVEAVDSLTVMRRLTGG